jgi:uncharacterized protein YggE
MTRFIPATVFAFSLFAAPSIFGQADSQSQNFQDHVITVNRGGTAYAKPDLGVLVMSVRSSSAVAEEAVAENGRKVQAVESGLAQLGFAADGYKITSVTFGQAGGPRYMPAPAEVTAYEANQTVYVFFQAADLNDVGRLTQRAAAVIEALRKAGAVPANISSPGLSSPQGSLIIYTIKDPDPYEKQAMQQAIGRARDAAEDIAKGTGVQITGLRNVKSGFLSGNYMPRSGQNNALEGLTYRWYSTKNDVVEISANATVDYNFK